MTWVERIDKRNQRNKTWQDSENPNKFSLDATLAALHYESEIDSGVFDTNIDAAPVRVVNAQFDGWLITNSGWHYALGQDIANHGTQDGWVGFGGRKGQHWFKFRLARVGYLHWPTRAWDDIGDAPDYKRQNLTQQTNEITFATDESTQPIASVANWADVWKTPVGGSLSVSWRIDGGRLKEEITINQAGREWITANRPPTTPLVETYFGFVFQLDWSDIPKVYRQGILQDIEGDFADDDEPIELKDALDRALAFMPISDVRVENADPELEVHQPLRKRFYKDTDGNYYLLLGVRADILNGMPAGDLIFDPTVQVGADEDDAYTYGGGTRNDRDYVYTNYHDAATVFSGFRFLSVGVPNSATIDVAYFQGYISEITATYIDFDLDMEAIDTATAPEGGTLLDNRNLTGNSVAFVEEGFEEWHTSPSIVDAVQAVVDRGGWASGQDMCAIGEDAQRETSRGTFTDYSLSTTFASKLHIEYTAGEGPQSVTLDTLTLAGSVPSASVTPGAVTVTLDALTLAGSVPASAVQAQVTVTLDVLTLASSVPSLTVTPGVVTITLDALTLAGSVPSASVTPGAVTVTLDALTLAGSVPSASVTPGAVTIPLDALTLASSVPSASVTPGSIIITLDALILASTLIDLTVGRGAALSKLKAGWPFWRF